MLSLLFPHTLLIILIVFWMFSTKILTLHLQFQFCQFLLHRFQHNYMRTSPLLCSSSCHMRKNVWSSDAPSPPFSHQVLSIEKAESTSLLPNPVIVSVRTKKAFQLIELQDRNELVESLNSRLRSIQWKQSMFRSRKDGKRSLVRVMWDRPFYLIYLIGLLHDPFTGLCFFFMEVQEKFTHDSYQHTDWAKKWAEPLIIYKDIEITIKM